MSLFRVYIGGRPSSVKFTDVPINNDVRDFHFIVAFAKDYDTDNHPTNGQFVPYWNADHFNISTINQIVADHRKVKVFFSIGERDGNFPFNPVTPDTWIDFAFDSLKKIVNDHAFSGIEVNYEGIKSTTEVFARCVGTVLKNLKDAKVISFASIAPSAAVQDHYLALYQGYKQYIDFVNFQSYADHSIKLDAPGKFLGLFERQISNYPDGKLLAGFSSDKNDDYENKHPPRVVLTACEQLLQQRKLKGIFCWSADSSSNVGFQYVQDAQKLLAGATGA